MAETSTKQHDSTRHIENDTLQSLNLKIDNNLNEYIVLIVGIHDHYYLFENFPTIISKDRLHAFNDIQTCLEFLQNQRNINVFIIISGTLAQDSVDKFVPHQHVVGLYIYCIDVNKHATWTNGIPKIRCIVSDATQLLLRLHGDIKQLSGRWLFNEKSFQEALTHDSQWYHLFLLVICNYSSNNNNSYREMFNDCRAYYRNNLHMTAKIDELEQRYDPRNAISEYTRDSFLYRIINHALRTQNMEIIQKFSPFIRDLHCQLYQRHYIYYRSSEQSIRVVYRGQSLSLDELNYLNSICESRRPIITLATFSSTSLDPNVALDFASLGNNRIPCLFEIIITDEYNIEQQHMIEHKQAFADISSLSNMPDEQEVLFSLVTHFRVKHVEYPIGRDWAVVTLELIDDKQGKCSVNHFSIVKAIERETDPQIYTDILHLLKDNATDEIHSNSMNWNKWWSRLASKWGTEEARQLPLLLTLCSCFTDKLCWSRKAIEMQKHILRSTPLIQSNLSSFSYLFKHYRCYQSTPTIWIAIYEDYLEKFCIINTKEILQCLSLAGQMYQNIADKEHALECYQKALDLNIDDKYNMNSAIQRQIDKLKKIPKTISTTKKERITVVQNIHERLRQLLIYLRQCQEWYDAADSKILLRISGNNTDGLSVKDYRSTFLFAVEKHLSSRNSIEDSTNNYSLSLWRYQKYMHDWILFNAIENFVNPFQRISIYSLHEILCQLRQLTKKLSVLITLCTVYICYQYDDDKIKTTQIPFIHPKDTTINKLPFLDSRDSDLLVEMKILEQDSSMTNFIRECM